MSEFRLFIHIGYPKCFSTALQRDFFDKHSDINFMGVGRKDNVSYINKDMEFINETILKYSSEFHYRKNIKLYTRAFKASLSKDKVNIISNEYLSFKFSPHEIDSSIKLKRLHELSKEFNPFIFFITRSPIDIINSLYKEYIRLGYPKSYNEFILWLWNYRDRNFFYDLFYLKKKKELEGVFGIDKVKYFNFEKIRNESEKFVNNELSKFLGIRNECLPLNNHNLSLTDEESLILLDSNTKKLRNFGEPAFASIENHRNRVWFKKGDAVIDEYGIYKNVYQKRIALATISEKAMMSKNLFELNNHGRKALNYILSELKNE